MWKIGFAFEYPLDDPYIHLAMASEISKGGYGVNSGEIASAASSALFPLLLTPFADTDFQRFLPLIWNVIGLVLTAWIVGKTIIWSGLRGACSRMDSDGTVGGDAAEPNPRHWGVSGFRGDSDADDGLLGRADL